MAWVDVYKEGDNAKTYRITEEAYALIFKEQGYRIVGNAQNKAAVTQNADGKENVQPNAEQPSKRQYNKRSE